MSADRAPNRGLITAGLMMTMVMGSLDTTVVNVALPHMQASLSASPEQITWVLTSYIVAAAVTTPVSGWLAARFGLKPMLLVCVGGFTVASILCGLATTLPEMVLFRVLQGVLYAPVPPLAQAVLFNINPPERYGRAMALFTMAAVVAPVVGPVVGGYLTEDLSWRWCFYINLPPGLGAVLLLWIFLPADTPQPRRFDFMGFGSLAVAIAAFQLMLDRGASQDWFASHEIWIEAALAGAAFWMFLIHSATSKQPIFPPALLANRNYVTAVVFTFFFSLMLYGSMMILPLMMQGVLGYSVLHSGEISMPRGVVMIIIVQITGRLDARIDRRVLISVGLALLTASFWMLAQLNLDSTGRQIIWANIVQGVGQGLVFVPLSTLALATVSPMLRPDASAMSNLIRNLGGSIGVAAMQAMNVGNTQKMHAALAAHVNPDDPVVRYALPKVFSPQTAQGAMALNAEITRQAMMVAYVDAFRLMAFIGLICAPLILLLRQPAAPGTPADRKS